MPAPAPPPISAGATGVSYSRSLSPVASPTRPRPIFQQRQTRVVKPSVSPRVGGKQYAHAHKHAHMHAHVHALVCLIRVCSLPLRAPHARGPFSNRDKRVWLSLVCLLVLVVIMHAHAHAHAQYIRTITPCTQNTYLP